MQQNLVSQAEYILVEPQAMGFPQTSFKGLDIRYSNSDYEQQSYSDEFILLGFPRDGNLLEGSIQSPASGLSKPIHVRSPPSVVAIATALQSENQT